MLLRCESLEPPMSQLGHSRYVRPRASIDPLPQCPESGRRHGIGTFRVGLNQSIVGQCGLAMLLTCGEQLLPPNNFRASRRSYSPSARPVRFRRASGSGRSASPATGTGSRVVSVLGIVVPGACASCMGLILSFRCEPSPPALDVADDGLAAFVDVDVLDRDFLRAFAAVAIEGFQQRRVCPRELVRLVEILAPALERLFADHGAPVALHRCVVAGDELRGDHPLEFVARRDADQNIDRSHDAAA